MGGTKIFIVTSFKRKKNPIFRKLQIQQCGSDELIGQTGYFRFLYFLDKKSDKTVTNLDLTTKDNVTRDSFKKHIKRFATIKAKRFICFLKESRVTLSFVVKSKLVTVLSLFLFTFLQLPLAASMILGLNYVRSDSRVVI